MTGFNHVLVGVSIAIVVRNPILAPIAAFLSHFVLDSLPHFGRHKAYKTWSKAFLKLLSLDAFLCFGVLALAVILHPDQWLLISVCAFMATLPDWLWNAKYILHVDNWFFRFHSWIQWGERPWGFWIEVPFAMLMTVFLITFKN